MDELEETKSNMVWTTCSLCGVRLGWPKDSPLYDALLHHGKDVVVVCLVCSVEREEAPKKKKPKTGN